MPSRKWDMKLTPIQTFLSMEGGRRLVVTGRTSFGNLSAYQLPMTYRELQNDSDTWNRAGLQGSESEPQKKGTLHWSMVFFLHITRPFTGVAGFCSSCVEAGSLTVSLSSLWSGLAEPPEVRELFVAPFPYRVHPDDNFSGHSHSGHQQKVLDSPINLANVQVTGFLLW